MPVHGRPHQRPAPRPAHGRQEPAPRVRGRLRHGDDRAVPHDQLRPVRRARPHRHVPAPHGRTLRPSAAQGLAKVEGKATDGLPTVLFLCVHNAGRSQMALGWFNHLAGGRAVAWSGGSEPGKEINPSAVLAMAEVGIDITEEFPKPWTDEIVQAADVVITMGCGDACPLFPGKRYEDWELEDPAGQDVDAVRPIRDDIEQRVRTLLDSLGVPTG